MTDPILVVGHGRSGTNWMLNLLDLSSETHCRNEPNELEGSPLGAIRTPRARHGETDVAERWESAVAWTLERQGERDHTILVRKRHLHGWSQALGLPALVRRPKVRGALSTLLPSLRAPEWPLPSWLGRRHELRGARLVLNVHAVGAWLDWLLVHRPGIRVVHVVRHPGGFLRSWQTRYLAKNDRDFVARENVRRLEEVRRLDPEWAASFGDPAELSIEETELLYWRYSTEWIHTAAEGHPAYRLVMYEDLTRETERVLREVYDHCGLTFADEVAAHLSERPARPETLDAWRSKLDAHALAAVARVLEESPLGDWWPDAVHA